MKFDYTPGPWLPTVHLDVITEDGSPIARRASTRGKYEYEEANARLIAAAPDLLEASQAAWNCIGELPPTQARVEVAQMLQAAIEKATGETP